MSVLASAKLVFGIDEILEGDLWEERRIARSFNQVILDATII